MTISNRKSGYRSNGRNSRRTLGMVAVAIGFCVLTATAAAAASLSDGQVCNQIKQAVEANGHYTYHYKDPAHPNLPLYNVYVRSNSECAADEGAEAQPVPSLVGCDIPTCGTLYDYTSR